jgi:hypothetical protein
MCLLCSRCSRCLPCFRFFTCICRPMRQFCPSTGSSRRPCRGSGRCHRRPPYSGGPGRRERLQQQATDTGPAGQTNLGAARSSGRRHISRLIVFTVYNVFTVFPVFPVSTVLQVLHVHMPTHETVLSLHREQPPAMPGERSMPQAPALFRRTWP